MASPEDIQKLAALARISIPEEELPHFAAEIESILAYVGKLDVLTLPETGQSVSPVRNVFREDEMPHESGKYTEALAAQFRDRKGDLLSVKQIITHE